MLIAYHADYIAHDGLDQSLVVAHEGTDAKNILSILNDAQFGLVPLNVSRFPESAGSTSLPLYFLHSSLGR